MHAPSSRPPEGADGCATGRRPGAWPIARPGDPDRCEAEQRHDRRGYARFHVVLGSIRADLEEQPSRRAVRAAARRWCNAIVQLADEVASGVTR